jgi:aminoglycoside phosphotransferase (APT) family kinase protein
MEARLVELLRDYFPDAAHIDVIGFEPIPGGYSRETYRFDAVVTSSSGEELHPLILRKDPPPAVSILQTSREIEHDLIEALRMHTHIPIGRSLGHEMDPERFGEPAMVIQRMHGKSQTSDLFHDGPDAHHADDVMRHLCEVLVELHTTDISTIDPHGRLADPRAAGIDASTWDTYIDTTTDYYIRSFPTLNTDPTMTFLLDLFLTLRRNKPRPLPLVLVHGDFNPANFLYDAGRVTALIDWENARVGDPREDLGWMTTMDILSNTNVMAHPVDEGGFLAYYNSLTGFEVTQDEVDYFTLFGTANIAVPVNGAIKRRVDGESVEFMPLYLVQSSLGTVPNLLRLLAYPGVPA